QCDGRWKGEREPGRCRTERTGAHESKRETYLAAGRPGQKLAQGDESRLGLSTQPTATRNKLLVKIPQMGDRPAEGGQAQQQEGEEDLLHAGNIALPVFFPIHQRAHSGCVSADPASVADVPLRWAIRAQ